MAATSSQSNNGGIANVAVGNYLEDDTAVAFTITTGFKPRWVRVVNETAGHSIEWYEGMADAEGLKTTEDSGTVDIAMVTSNGITPTSRGFTVGLDTDINVVDEQMSWIAIG